MGAVSANRCDGSSLAARCKTTCRAFNLGEIHEVASSSKTLGSWAEEDVEDVHITGTASVNADYDVIQALVERQDRFSGDSSSTSAKRLYRPGHLCRIQSYANGLQSMEDTYELGEVAGNGAYGYVYKGTHRRTGAVRAIKVVGKEALRKYLQDVDSFVRREVDILRRVDHPNIVRLYEASEGSDIVCLALEYCSGGDVLERITVGKERMPERDAARLLCQMLSAIEHLHLHGVVHRDIKPENFLFAGDGTGASAAETVPLKLIDFGLSKRVSGAGGLYRMTPKIGTTEYMAPETYQGQVRQDCADRTDLWSLGVLLHVVFVGHFPSAKLLQEPLATYFSAQCWHRVSKQGLHLLGQLLQRDPTSRPSATIALKHPWLSESTSARGDSISPSLPAGSVHTFASSASIARLGFAAAGREEDALFNHNARCVFDTLSRACDGAITRSALSKIFAEKGNLELVKLAHELLENFDEVDMDQSGELDWSEVLAVVLCSARSRIRAARSGAQVPVGSVRGLSENTCFRAFDFLSGGGEEITASALAALTSRVGSQQGGTAVPTLVDVSSASTWDAHLQEVGTNGALDFDGFIRMMQ